MLSVHCTNYDTNVYRVEDVVQEYNSQNHTTTGFPPCWLLYGVVPKVYWQLEPSLSKDYVPPCFSTPTNDRLIAYNRIRTRAEKRTVVVKNTEYVVSQSVLVQLNSRARDAEALEWASVGRIISLCDDENKVRVQFLNNNIYRPIGSEEEVDVKLLRPIIEDVDICSSIRGGEFVTKPHPHNIITARDVVAYIDQLYLRRRIGTCKTDKYEQHYLLRYSGEQIHQVRWVPANDVKNNQLSHAELLFLGCVPEVSYTKSHNGQLKNVQQALAECEGNVFGSEFFVYVSKSNWEHSMASRTPFFLSTTLEVDDKDHSFFLNPRDLRLHKEFLTVLFIICATLHNDFIWKDILHETTAIVDENDEVRYNLCNTHVHLFRTPSTQQSISCSILSKHSITKT